MTPGARLAWEMTVSRYVQMAIYAEASRALRAAQLVRPGQPGFGAARAAAQEMAIVQRALSDEHYDMRRDEGPANSPKKGEWENEAPTPARHPGMRSVKGGRP